MCGGCSVGAPMCAITCIPPAAVGSTVSSLWYIVTAGVGAAFFSTIYTVRKFIADIPQIYYVLFGGTFFIVAFLVFIIYGVILG